MRVRPLEGRVALVTGANHGIGASTALALAGLGADVVVTYLRLDIPDDDPARPAAYAQHRRQDATAVIDAVRAAGSEGWPSKASTAIRRVVSERCFVPAITLLRHRCTG
ncbi:MAG: hypothetical protein ACYCV7_17070 [Acidimicrobiales bacterium]